jgi:hypothetical protein
MPRAAANTVTLGGGANPRLRGHPVIPGDRSIGPDVVVGPSPGISSRRWLRWQIITEFIERANTQWLLERLRHHALAAARAATMEA